MSAFPTAAQLDGSAPGHNTGMQQAAAAAFLNATTGLLGTDGVPATARAALGIARPAVRNIVRNNNFKVNQMVTMPTADNTFGPDGWRLLLEAANAAVWTLDTADVPAGARACSVLTVGAGNNNKFGIFQPIEALDSTEWRNKATSLIAGLKATAGLANDTGKIRMALLGFTGTADAITGDPITAWGAEGTNPTLSASWAYQNVPVALAVGTAWADWVVENIAIGATVNNLGLFIWSDSKTTTTTTDVLRIAYPTWAEGATAPLAQGNEAHDELTRCQRYLEKSFAMATAPATGVASGRTLIQTVGASAAQNGHWVDFKVKKRATPTMTTYNPAAANAHVRNLSTGGDCSATATGATDSGFGLDTVTHGTSSAGQVLGFNWLARDAAFA